MACFLANIAVTFAARLVQEEAIKTGLSHESAQLSDINRHNRGPSALHLDARW